MTEAMPQLPPRPADGHKGTFGTVCVIGGRADDQRVMVGGPAFAALGALRSGCGLAVLAAPTPVMAAALVIAPSATGLALPVDDRGELKSSDVAQLIDRHASSYNCIAIGPGLGDRLPQQQIVIRLTAQDQLPLVIDADGLNALANLREFHRDFRAQAVLTPHPGEFKKLADALDLKADAIDPQKRQHAASQLAQRLGCVVVLKGHRSVISDGMHTHVNESGNVALATGGTGDVLTGIIAGFIAQFVKRPAGGGGFSLFDCARLAVHVHGLAADHWAEKHGNTGMLATDLLAEIPQAIANLRSDSPTR
jgi:ADP-dependent NAD(P)H-hydrate dehydratase